MAINNLTLRTVNSPYIGNSADFTKNSVLTHKDVDNNFIFLKGEDIITDKERENFEKRNNKVKQALSGVGLEDTQKDIDKKPKELDSKVSPITKIKPETAY